jgi:putative Ca2+/H+ antiporter (TMEM165/GDT1 family)
VHEILIGLIVLGTVFVAELPDNSGLAGLVLGTKFRAAWVFAGGAAAFAVHVVLAVTVGYLFGLLPHRVIQLVVAVVFLIGAALILRGDDDDDDDAKLKAGARGFWSVAATSFLVLLIAELGDLSDVTIAALSARYHDPIAVGIGSALGLWGVLLLYITGGQGLLRVLPMKWITRLAAVIMVVMAVFTLVEALH